MNWLADTVAITGTVLGVFSIGTFMTGWWHLTPYVLMMSGALLLAGGLEITGQLRLLGQAETEADLTEGTQLGGHLRRVLTGLQREQGAVLLDTQWMTGHLRQFGGYELPRQEYLQELQDALATGT